MKKKILIALLLVAGSYNTIFAQQPAVMLSDKKGWHKIGETSVDFTKEKDELIVLGADRFASIRFEVTEAAIDLQDLEIYYENGKKQDVSVRTPIMMGNESRVIDLNGGESALKKIVFVYKTYPNRKDTKAHVLVWGLKTNADKGNADPVNTEHADKPNGEIAKPAVIISDKPGWHKIGEMHVDLKKDRDEMKVLGKDQFRQIKFKAEDAAIEFNDIEIYFENDNTPQIIHIGMILKKDEETKSMDLRGTNKPINKIVFMYKTAPNQLEEKAEVEIYGLK
ncbi:MAG: hypothetical protein ABIT08_10120 [Bacteroidia bacterium]